MKKLNLFIIVAAAITLTLAGCKEEATGEGEQRIEPVRVQKLEMREFDRVTLLSVVLQGYETQNVAPSVTGTIKRIYVEESSRVSRGDNLVMMDELQYKTAQLNYANMGVEMGRMEALLRTGSVTQQAYDNLLTQYKTTKENLDFLEENTYVKAQFSGVIAAKNYEEGELYAGQPILVLTQINLLKAEVAVPESHFPLVKEGMPVDLTSEIYPGEIFKGTIEKIFPTVDVASHTFTVKVKIPNANERLRPGMYTQARMTLGRDSAIVVPYQAVLKLQGANNRYVFMNDNGVAKRVDVTLGQRFDDEVEIISDQIKPGDEMVVEGEARLVDGAKLEIKE